MKNKKGFVFVETIVVCSVLAISLVTIYASFALLINEQKKRNKYDQAVYNYRLYYIVKDLHTAGVLDNCTDSDYTLLNTSLEDIFNLESLHYIKASNVANISFDNNNYLNEYKKTISENSDSCVLIGEFKTYNDKLKKDEYYYSHVIIDEV